mmetsp:Transcript_10324/g.30212  ORF Transcript_10324/g.30212 Transcript_10324/m.30212 type:complete len:194 (-) Transcript_10324:641-1222(-)
MKGTGARRLLRKHRCSSGTNLGSSSATTLTENATGIRMHGVDRTGNVQNSAVRILRGHPCRSFSSKGPKPTGKKPRVKLSTPGGGVDSAWYTSAGTSPALDMGRYGLKRLDYTHMKPPVWTAPPHPPTKTTAERVVFPLTLMLAAGVVFWVYMSPEEDDMTEYWKRVESGQILLDDDYDDDDDDYDDDDEEEE